MNDHDEWSFEACQAKLRNAAESIRGAEEEYHRNAERSADAEAVYRNKLAASFKGHREAGMAVEAATTLSRADVAVLSRERDYAKDLVRLSAEKIENRRDALRSLWRLIEWARGRDLREPS